MVVPPAPADAGLSTPDQPEAPDTGAPDAPGAPTRPSLFRPVLAGVLLVVLVAAATIAGVLLLTGDDGSGDTQAGREEVMAQTEQFMLRMGTYGPDLLDDTGAMPDYRAGVKEVITPKFAASFDEEAGAAEQLVAQAGVERVPDVFATGVSTIDADSATTLVAGSFTDSYTVEDRTVPQEPIPFRIEVSLVKIDGEWLVDDFSPVAGSSAVPAPGQGDSP